MNLLVFLGSARDSSPPYPPRLGERVARACLSQLNGETQIAELIDPLDYAQPAIFKPHFAFAEAKAPADLNALAKKIADADAYVMVSPEYNHSMSPALAHLLNHFGSSLFAFKPSAIVTYSAGQWGGARAAMGMRAYLSELGCLPVSAMIHVPKAQEVFAEDGSYLAGVDSQRWHGYLGRSFAQLGWWAETTRRQRQEKNPQKLSPAFLQSPSQRDAP